MTEISGIWKQKNFVCMLAVCDS